MRTTVGNTSIADAVSKSIEEQKQGMLAKEENAVWVDSIVPSSTTPSSSGNNGGATSMYDLPPESDRPTLDDLIEYKEMAFWRANCFKALYALDERAQRSSDSSSSELRELNKILYYISRRLTNIKPTS